MLFHLNATRYKAFHHLNYLLSPPLTSTRLSSATCHCFVKIMWTHCLSESASRAEQENSYRLKISVIFQELWHLESVEWHLESVKSSVMPRKWKVETKNTVQKSYNYPLCCIPWPTILLSCCCTGLDKHSRMPSKCNVAFERYHMYTCSSFIFKFTSKLYYSYIHRCASILILYYDYTLVASICFSKSLLLFLNSRAALLDCVKSLLV